MRIGALPRDPIGQGHRGGIEAPARICESRVQMPRRKEDGRQGFGRFQEQQGLEGCPPLHARPIHILRALCHDFAKKARSRGRTSPSHAARPSHLAGLHSQAPNTNGR